LFVGLPCSVEEVEDGADASVKLCLFELMFGAALSSGTLWLRIICRRGGHGGSPRLDSGVPVYISSLLECIVSDILSLRLGFF
jgi:hypothetical protein